MKKIFKVLLLLTLLTLALQASSSIVLTQKEQDFIKAHKVITLGTDKGWAPYVMQNDDGTIGGYDADVLKLINDISGTNFKLKLGSFSDMKKEAKNRTIDGLSTAVVTEEFKEYHLFSKPYISLRKIIFTSTSNKGHFFNLQDLEGKRFGVNSNNSMSIDFAKSIPNVKIIYFESTKKLIEGVATEKADVMLGNAAMFHLLNKTGNPFLKPTLFLNKDPLELIFALRDDYPEAVSIINKSLEIIGKNRLFALKTKWFGVVKSKTATFRLTQKERNYLKHKKQINMCINPNIMPIEKIHGDEHIGITSDFFKIFQEDIGTPIILVKTENWNQSLEYVKNRKCDILSLSMDTPERKKYLNFTTPYFYSALVLVTKPNVTFIDNVEQLQDEKIGVVKGYASYEMLRKQYPKLNLIGVKNIKDGLQKVADGKLFGYIENIASVGYMYQTSFMNELKISGKIKEKLNLGVGVRNDELMLLSIFNKSIKNLSPQTKQGIINKYLAIKYEKGFNYILFWTISALLMLVIIFLLVRYRVVHKYNEKIKKQFQVIDENVLLSSSDLKGNMTYVSQALCHLSGYSKEELLGKNSYTFIDKDMSDDAYKDMWDCILDGDIWIGDIKNIRKNRSNFWTKTKVTPVLNSKNKIIYFSILREDITDKKALEKITITDTLTNVPNRLYLDKNYNKEFERARRYNSIFSIVFVDIDFFKSINDTYGHQVGDDVLVQTAQLLQNNLRNIDILGRWGGEEFLIICPESTLEDANMLALKLKDIVEYYDFPDVHSLTCSFGVSQHHKSDKKEDLIERVDKALYRAKENGRNRVEIG